MAKFNDLSGQQFGKWTVLHRDLEKTRPITFICKCECGNIKSINSQNILRGLSSQCMDCQAISKSQDLIGKRFNSLLVLSVEKVNGKCSAKVKCDCGIERYLSPALIKSGTYKSCGQCSLNRTKKKYPYLYGQVEKTYGYLTIIEKISNTEFLAQCVCGKKLNVKTHHLTTMKPSCGCFWKKIHEDNAKKLIGTKFGYLTVISFLGMKGIKKRAHYLLKCKCGVKIEKSISYAFGSRSCGCLQKESVPKGSKNHNSKLKEYEVSSMRQLFSTGLYSRKELSIMFDLAFANVCYIIKRKSWKHI